MISGDIGDSAEILGEKFIYTDLSKKISEIYLNYAKFHQSFLKIKKENIKKFSFENYIDKIKKYYKRIVL